MKLPILSHGQAKRAAQAVRPNAKAERMNVTYCRKVTEDVAEMAVLSLFLKEREVVYRETDDCPEVVETVYDLWGYI